MAVSDISGAWYHCSRCGSLFKAAADAGRRGNCPDCGGDPSGEQEPQEAAGPVRVRRKIRKKPEGNATSPKSSSPRSTTFFDC